MWSIMALSLSSGWNCCGNNQDPPERGFCRYELGEVYPVSQANANLTVLSGRVPVIAGASSNSTLHAIATARVAQKAGEACPPKVAVKLLMKVSMSPERHRRVLNHIAYQQKYRVRRQWPGKPSTLRKQMQPNELIAVSATWQIPPDYGTLRGFWKHRLA
jgi:hypothetical protein